ncbi:hypothetical protein KH5H1_19410 [Corallococcus caeni]|uniref:Uncharacterized protein n=1 Tax=Corallococcus caeni TaxID=3082388 RepID=A0ABQ6QTN7_9BACT|nr:hypothetical protein KH5H1_19410 [Corallococcus sp. KH5-1]GMU07385.1 hypothetical protein ASNO1_36380 [Corallococcus sp. NO1]
MGFESDDGRDYSAFVVVKMTMPLEQVHLSDDADTRTISDWMYMVLLLGWIAAFTATAVKHGGVWTGGLTLPANTPVLHSSRETSHVWHHAHPGRPGDTGFPKART